MVEVNGAYKHSTYEKNVSNVSVQCPTLKFLPCKMDGQTNTTHYTDPHVTRMDQNKEIKQTNIENKGRNKTTTKAQYTVMLWPVQVQKVPQASEHLCPAKLQTRCDICCACYPHVHSHWLWHAQGSRWYKSEFSIFKKMHSYFVFYPICTPFDASQGK